MCDVQSVLCAIEIVESPGNIFTLERNIKDNGEQISCIASPKNPQALKAEDLCQELPWLIGRNITALDLSFCIGINEENLPDLRALITLKYLKLYGTGIMDCEAIVNKLPLSLNMDEVRARLVLPPGVPVLYEGNFLAPGMGSCDHYWDMGY
jgi:hypothetical protein